MTGIHSSRFIILTLCVVSVLGCGSGGPGGELEDARLVEGRGIEPDLLIGTTTLSQARGALGKAANEPSTAGPETTVEAGPFRLVFDTPVAGGEPLLHAIRTARVPNPSYPRWNGKTAGEIGFLDTEEKVRTTYGQPAAEWHRSFGGRALYYISGLRISTF